MVDVIVGPMQQKACCSCGMTKVFSEFFRYSNSNSYFKRCKVCEGVKRKADRAEAKRIRIAARVTQPPPAIKYCPACKETKPIDSFRKNTGKKSGAQSYCTPCMTEYARYHRLENKDKYRAFDMSSIDRGVKDRNSKQYREDNKEICYQREIAARSKKPDYYASKAREAMRKKREENPLFRVQSTIRCRINGAMRKLGYKKGSRTQEILGCDWDMFKTHIEKQFTKGMAWDDMGVKIHIDHIVPISTASTEDELIALNHFTNLRPMWARDNMVKGAKVTHLI